MYNYMARVDLFVHAQRVSFRQKNCFFLEKMVHFEMLETHTDLKQKKNSCIVNFENTLCGPIWESTKHLQKSQQCGSTTNTRVPCRKY